MEVRSGAHNERNGGGTLGRDVWLAYLRTGTAMAILRVSLLAWVEQRTASHQMTMTVYSVVWCLRPELLLGEYTRVGEIHFNGLLPHFLFWSSILTVGSFIIATPILLVGWLRQRRA
jgi:hypothetical protein